MREAEAVKRSRRWMDWVPPVVEKGVPLPPPKKPRPPREPDENPWVIFLLGLQKGDSFCTDYWDGNNVRTYLKKLNIDFEVRSMGNHPSAQYWRFWIVEHPPAYDFVLAFKHLADGI